MMQGDIMKFLFSAFIMIICSVQFSFGQALNFWQKAQGPYGGFFTNVDKSGNMLLASTTNNLYMSADIGESWQMVDIYGNAAEKILTSGEDIFLVIRTPNGKFDVFYSENNELNFESMDWGTRPRINNIRKIDGDIWLATYAGIYRYDGQAADWEIVNEMDITTNSKIVTDLAESQAGRIFASTLEGLYYSDDSGESWQETIEGIDYSIYSKNVERLACLNGLILMATPGDVYKSEDNGDSWIKINDNNMTGNTGALCFDDEGNIIVGKQFGGLFKSTDSGSSWMKLSDESVRAFYIGGDDIFIGTISTLLYSDDECATMECRCGGINETTVSAIGINKSNEIICSDHSGIIYKSADKGDSWIKSADLGFAVNDFCLDWDGTISGDAVMWAATQWGGVYKSTDGGNSWLGKNSGMDDPDVKKVGVLSTGEVIAAAYSTVFGSNDGGESWYDMIPQASQSVNCVEMLIGSNDNIYVSTFAYGLFRKTPQQGGFTQIQAGLGNSLVTQLTETEEGTLYAVLEGSRLAKSEDYGDTWTIMPMGISYVQIFYDKDCGFFTTEHSDYRDAVYRANNEDLNWNDISSGLPGKYATDFMLDKDYFIYSISGGIYRSIDDVRIQTDVDDEENKGQLVLSPNPASDKIKLNFDPVLIPDEIKIFNMLGKQMHINYEKNSTQPVIDITGFAPGIYILIIETGNYSHSEKFAVVK